MILNDVFDLRGEADDYSQQQEVEEGYRGPFKMYMYVNNDDDDDDDVVNDDDVVGVQIAKAVCEHVQ